MSRTKRSPQRYSDSSTSSVMWKSVMWTIASRNWPAWQRMCREELTVLNSTQRTSLAGYGSKIQEESLTNSEMEGWDSDYRSNV
jgi:hypothetical protein